MWQIVNRPLVICRKISPFVSSFSQIRSNQKVLRSDADAIITQQVFGSLALRGRSFELSGWTLLFERFCLYFFLLLFLRFLGYRIPLSFACELAIFEPRFQSDTWL